MDSCKVFEPSTQWARSGIYRQGRLSGPKNYGCHRGSLVPMISLVPMMPTGQGAALGHPHVLDVQLPAVFPLHGLDVESAHGNHPFGRHDRR